MRDVARAAGVSVQTVSNVVNDRSNHMTATTEAQIRAIIDELGFRPNQVARGLRWARTETIGFLVMDPAAHFLGDPMTDLFLAGLGDELRDRAYELLIRASRQSESIDPLLTPLTEGRVDMAIISLSGEPEERARYIEELGDVQLPFVLLQEHQPGGLPTVCAEDREGSRRICRHLITRGHKRIAFITATHHWSAIEERIAGYRQAHEEAGLELDEALVVWDGEFSPLPAANAAGNVLDRDPSPTAVMAGNDLIALGVMRAAQERGLRIPQDLAVTGFDDFEFAAAIDPPLTTARIPGYEMGRFAAQMLIDASEQEIQPHSRVFPCDVLLRRSA